MKPCRNGHLSERDAYGACRSCKAQAVRRYMSTTQGHAVKLKANRKANAKWMLSLANRKKKKRADRIWKKAHAHELRTPKWADMPKITAIYAKADSLNKSVDHVIPLRGKLVCGLHVHNNLRIVSQRTNAKKGNKYEIGA